MKFDIALQPKQLEVARIFNTRGDLVPRKIGFGGALGGGKSGLIRRLMLQRRFDIPGTMGAIVRRVYDDLKTNHIDVLFKEYPALTEYWNSSSRELRLPNRSVYRFLWAENEIDVQRKFPGAEFYDLYVDQAEQFTESELLTMQERVRWPDVPLGSCKFGCFFNPGGPGMEYLRRVFWLRQYRGKEQASDFHFTQAYGWDNYQWFTHMLSQADFYALSDAERFELFITKTDYGREIDSRPKGRREAALLGSFEHFEGQYFAGVWDEDKCVLSPELVNRIVKPWWTRWMAQDWAYAEHAAHGWFASGKISPSEWKEYFGGDTEWPMDVVVEYREHVVKERAELDLAMDIVNLTPQHERPNLQRFFLSQDAFGQKAKQGGDHTVGIAFTDVMRRYKMPSPEPAHQERVNGWRFLYNMFRQAGLRGTTFDQDRAKQGPALFISAECVNSISCIPIAIRDDDEPDDMARVDGALWEDVLDKIRYGTFSMLGSKTKAPVEVRAREVYEAYEDPTSRALALRKFHDVERRGKMIVRGRRGR